MTTSPTPEHTFDDARAHTFQPRPGAIKHAFVVNVPPDFTTRLWMDATGAPQSIIGPYYIIYDPATKISLYASDQQTWHNTNVPVPDTLNGWRKASTVRAYLYRPTRDEQLTTPLPAGRATWIVRQRDGETQAIQPTDFERLYY